MRKWVHANPASGPTRLAARSPPACNATGDLYATLVFASPETDLRDVMVATEFDAPHRRNRSHDPLTLFAPANIPGVRPARAEGAEPPLPGRHLGRIGKTCSLSTAYLDMQSNTCLFGPSATEQGMDDDKVFKALADPSRRKLLDLLAENNGQTLGKLCEGLDMTRQSVTQHLGLLEQANLISTLRRGREKLHFINPVPLHDVYERWVAKFEKGRLSLLHDLKQALERKDE